MVADREALVLELTGEVHAPEKAYFARSGRDFRVGTREGSGWQGRTEKAGYSKYFPPKPTLFLEGVQSYQWDCHPSRHCTGGGGVPYAPLQCQCARADHTGSQWGCQPSRRLFPPGVGGGERGRVALPYDTHYVPKSSPCYSSRRSRFKRKREAV